MFIHFLLKSSGLASAYFLYLCTYLLTTLETLELMSTLNLEEVSSWKGVLFIANSNLKNVQPYAYLNKLQYNGCMIAAWVGFRDAASVFSRLILQL